MFRNNFLLCSALVVVAVTACESDDQFVLETVRCWEELAITPTTCEDFQLYMDCYSKECCKWQIDNDDVGIVDACNLKCAGCFPEDAQVELSTGQSKKMHELVVGDKVQVGTGEYSEVYYFSTQLTESLATFVNLKTKTTKLALTPGHYLYINDKLAQADTAQVGDQLTLADGSTSVILEVSSNWGTGLYNPHTMSGDIVVDGVLTSTYTNKVHPKLAHALLYPLRQLYTLGISVGTDFQDFTKGLPTWFYTLGSS